MKKFISWFLVMVMTAILLWLCQSCLPFDHLGKQPSYSYKYLRLKDRTIGYAQSYVLYDVGDTIELFPSKRKIVIVKVQFTHEMLNDSIN